MRKRFLRSNGQSLVEFAIILPFTVVLVLGVIELGYALLDQHVVAKLTREGSNLISRDTAPGNAALALKGMATRPVNFASGSKSDLLGDPKRRDDRDDELRQGHPLPALRVWLWRGCKRVDHRGDRFIRTGPEYAANNADGDASLQVTNLPAGLIVSNNAMVYITEIFTAHPLITPFDKFGINVPTTLYSIAYF